MNPVVYSIVNPRFRRDFAALFCCKSESKPKANVNQKKKKTQAVLPSSPAGGSDGSAKTTSAQRATDSTGLPDSSIGTEAGSSSDNGLINQGM